MLFRALALLLYNGNGFRAPRRHAQRTPAGVKARTATTNLDSSAPVRHYRAIRSQQYASCRPRPHLHSPHTYDGSNSAELSITVRSLTYVRLKPSRTTRDGMQVSTINVHSCAGPGYARFSSASHHQASTFECKCTAAPQFSQSPPFSTNKRPITYKEQASNGELCVRTLVKGRLDRPVIVAFAVRPLRPLPICRSCPLSPHDLLLLLLLLLLPLCSLLRSLVFCLFF